MDDLLLMGVGRYLLPIPPAIWRRQVPRLAQLGFMSEAHHRVRNFTVRELLRLGRPMPPECIIDIF